jgi:hypothetical protein
MENIKLVLNSHVSEINKYINKYKVQLGKKSSIMRLECMCILNQGYIFQLSTFVCIGNKFDHTQSIISQQSSETGSVSVITMSGHLDATGCQTDWLAGRQFNFLACEVEETSKSLLIGFLRKEKKVSEKRCRGSSTLLT